MNSSPLSCVYCGSFFGPDSFSFCTFIMYASQDPKKKKRKRKICLEFYIAAAASVIICYLTAAVWENEQERVQKCLCWLLLMLNLTLYPCPGDDSIKFYIPLTSAIFLSLISPMQCSHVLLLSKKKQFNQEAFPVYSEQGTFSLQCSLDPLISYIQAYKSHTFGLSYFIRMQKRASMIIFMKGGKKISCHKWSVL